MKINNWIGVKSKIKINDDNSNVDNYLLILEGGLYQLILLIKINTYIFYSIHMCININCRTLYFGGP